MRVLIIDANFFIQRVRNAASLSFIENPEADKQELLKSLSTTFASEFRRFDGTISRVVYCKDYSSWRKDHQTVLPFESVKTEDEGDYKANRGGDDSYDAVKFFAAADEFGTMLESIGVDVIRYYKSEADDSCHIISRLFASKGIKSILWSSDGDYIQNVDENTALFKLPKRELFLSNYATETKLTMESVFGSKPDVIDKVINIVGTDNVKHVNPYDYVIEQIIRGQSKDNIPPMFHWTKETKRGTQNCLPTWNNIKKAITNLGRNVEDMRLDDLYDDAFNKRLVLEVLSICKQTRDIGHCMKIFASNRKLAFLDKREIPEEIWQGVTKTAIESFKRQKLDHIKAASSDKILSQAGITVATDSFFNQFNLADV